MKRLVILPAILALGACGVSGPTRTPPPELIPDMKHQQKFKWQTDNSRRPPVGVVAVGHLDDKDMTAKWIPVPVTKELMQRGQQRFNIYCQPCHDRTGGGKGIVAIKAQYFQPANLMDPRIRGLADGEIFKVISEGKGNMSSYAAQVPVADRWAIIAYLRALQRATASTINDVPADLRAELK